MKKPLKLSTLVFITILAGLFLSSCAGGTVYNSWPGLTAGEEVVYLSYLNGVFAVNVNNGSQNWRFPEKADGGKSFYAPPSVGSDVLVAGDYTNTLYAINPANAAQTWAFSRGGGHFVGGALVLDDVILAPSSDHHLYALNSDGSLRWKFATANILWSRPASDGKLVYLAAMDHNLYALNLQDGSTVWKKDLGAALPSSPILAQDGTLYVVNMEGKLFAVESAGGTILWEEALGGQVWSTPLLHEGVLYIGNADHNAYAVSTTDNAQRILFKMDMGSALVGGAALFGDQVIFPLEDGIVQAVSLKGEKTWNYPVNGKLYTTPVVVADTLVVAIKDGEKLLVALNPNGSEKWTFAQAK